MSQRRERTLMPTPDVEPHFLSMASPQSLFAQRANPFCFYCFAHAELFSFQALHERKGSIEKWGKKRFKLPAYKVGFVVIIQVGQRRRSLVSMVTDPSSQELSPVVNSFKFADLFAYQHPMKGPNYLYDHESFVGNPYPEYASTHHSTGTPSSGSDTVSSLTTSTEGVCKKTQSTKDVVDLRTLLTHCAQAVPADDRRTAHELLKQVMQHSSTYGEGSQRLAYCFADGLEARLAGTGSQIYQSLVAKRTSASDILKAYQLFLDACPFKKISHFLSHQTILNIAEKASRVHIVDFGIFFGFQWPCLIQRLSSRPGGPPKLRITGIDVPRPGFRPTERIEETGRRLADYARSFNVPFEYNSIASKWEAIKEEDLKVDEDEVLIVNSLYRFRNLVDETVVADSPRSMVLDTIRRANPDVFIHGIVNGSYGAPFFVTRFREALFHYSALFDMLETTVPREDAQRMLIERDIFGREALNVISCEGSERVERPETYKQWQVRNLRAGFEQLPLDPSIMKKARDKVKTSNHEDLVIDEDSGWLLQGWKGRIIYAVSTWRPSKAS